MRNGFTRFVTAFPERHVTNDEPPYNAYAKKLLKNSGVEARYVAGPGDSVVSLSIASLNKLTQTLDGRHGPYDALVLATGELSDDARSRNPNDIAREVADAFKIPHAEAINFACSSFSAAVQRVLELRRDFRHVALVSTEKITDGLNFDEPQSAVLFGDGSAATSIAGDAPHEIHEAWVEELPSDTPALTVQKGEFADFNGVRRERIVFKMGSDATYDFAVRTLRQLSLEEIGRRDAEEVFVVPHQPSGRVLSAVQLQLDEVLPGDRFVNALRDTGNLAAASVPAALATVMDRIRAGAHVVCPTVGAGQCLAEGKLSRGRVTFTKGEGK